VAIYTFFLITWSGINHVAVSQHGSTFVGNVQQVAVTFLALIILEGGVSYLTIFLVIVSALGKMDDDVLDAVPGFCIEKLEGVVRGREMAIHAVGHEALLIVHMTGGLPGVVGKLNFVAAGAELWCCGAHHGVVG